MKGYHRWREGALALASLALLFLVLVAINFLAYRHPIRFDLSETKAFTLSPQTREVLASLKQNIQIRAYFESKDADTAERAKLLLTNYVQLSPKITFEIIDPWKNPAAARKDGITTSGQAVIVADGRREAITTLDEESITNAIVKVTRENQRQFIF